MRSRCLFAFWMLAWSFASFAAAAEQPTSRPNIIVMMADDLGYECLSANGSRTFQTPVVDKLAAGGARFNYCFAQPNCTPSRVQLMSGKSNVRNYVAFGYLHESVRTFGHLFRDAGYSTCIVGKWQLGGSVSEETPKHFGFDEHCLYHIHGVPKGENSKYSADDEDPSSRYINPGLVINGESKRYGDNAYAPDLCNDFVLDYLSRHRSKPFFLYYPMMLTHKPFDPTPDSSDYPGRNGPARSKEQHYQDMVVYNDKLVGKLLAKLDELDLRSNTLVLFTGDNGSPGGIETVMTDGQTIAAGKGSTLVTGMHVPLVASWPGVIKPRTACNDLVDLTDFLPTICEAARIGVPSDFVLDGRSFLPQLRGEKGRPREWIYSFWAPLKKGHLERVGRRGAVEQAFDHRYKLYSTGDFFDLAIDPDEERPMPIATLSGPAAKAAKQLQAALNQFADARPNDLPLVSAGVAAALEKYPDAEILTERKRAVKKNN